MDQLETLAIQERTEPRDGAPGRGERITLRRIVVTREVADRRPRAHVFGVSAKLLESVGPVGARKDVNTAIDVIGVMTDEHHPGLIEP